MSEDTSTPKPAQQTPAATPVPDGHVAISAAEHNRLQAELRRLKKEATDREAADAALKTQAERELAESRGQYDKALAAEQAARKQAEEKAAKLARESALLTEVTRRGFGGEQAAALLKLTDASQVTADGVNADAAVDAAIAKFPALFNRSNTPTPNPGNPNPASPTPPGSPSLPPSSTVYSQGYESVDGFVSMEEYVRTPHSKRITPEFQARVEKSRPFWPSQVPANSFAQSN